LGVYLNIEMVHPPYRSPVLFVQQFFNQKNFHPTPAYNGKNYLIFHPQNIKKS
jgi:hypothetical protein